MRTLLVRAATDSGGGSLALLGPSTQDALADPRLAGSWLAGSWLAGSWLAGSRLVDGDALMSFPVLSPPGSSRGPRRQGLVRLGPSRGSTGRRDGWLSS
ncbi:hypothetical protein [Streptomyces sp. NPDC049590]|uniref:hypothetical protein n=1 Tax=Streptomyces sp. NPDC049590 TaxID=3154834 RepID=UPI0034374F9C